MYPFLSNDIVKSAYIFDLQLSNFTDVTTTRMKLLSNKFNVQYMRSDEISSAKVDYARKTICDLPPSQCSFLTRLSESLFLICLQNVTVESGFSIMKFHDSVYQNNLLNDT